MDEIRLTDGQVAMLDDISREILALQKQRDAMTAMVLAGAEWEGPWTIDRRPDGSLWVVRPEEAKEADGAETLDGGTEP